MLERIICALRHFQQFFSYIAAVGFIGGGQQNTQWKSLICWKTEDEITSINNKLDRNVSLLYIDDQITRKMGQNE